MIDPILSLAVSVHGNKGVFALLLGSGVSRSAGIPTGWEIVQDFIRKLATLRSETCDPDPGEWFREKFNLEPDYSELLQQVARSPAERSQLLRTYFEPTEEERAEGRKLPTPAHRAIAELVFKGYIRVIVTTNFDRLLEQALVDVGIQPVVIGSADAVQGALPLTHSRCSIIKVNGDYLDTRLRNTRNELERYDQPLERLLDQVFDEYGLVICGWSADWDSALRAAMERCPNRRFTTYWGLHRQANTLANDLIALRGATAIPIVDADSFFTDLTEKVSALETFALADPLSAAVAVARLKRYLTSDSHKISLNDLISTETARVRNGLTNDRFPPQTAGQINGQAVLDRMRSYEADLRVLLPVLACGSRWAEPRHERILAGCLRRIANAPTSLAGETVWLDLRRYPSLLLLYGMGLAAWAGSNYGLLREMLSLSTRSADDGTEKRLVAEINEFRTLHPYAQRQLPEREREYTPLSNHLFSVLRDPLREYVPDDSDYDAAFDWFEYLLGLVYCDVEITRAKIIELKTSDPGFELWAPVGRFAWKTRQGGVQQRADLRDDGLCPERVAGLLKAGFFESGNQIRADKYLDVKAGFDRTVAKVRIQWHVFC